MSWRERVLHAAENWWRKNIIDGTDRGNRIIGTELLPAAGLKPRPDYNDGSLDWCGYTVQAIFLEAGFVAGASLASAGKVIFGYGLGNKTFDGAKAFAQYKDAFKEDRRVHQRYAEAKPGDILVRLKPGTYNGHVMLISGIDLGAQCLYTYEGNATGTLPDGTMKQGMVKKSHQWEVMEMGRRLRPFYVVSPSDSDFEASTMKPLQEVSILDKIMNPLHMLDNPNRVFSRRRKV